MSLHIITGRPGSGKSYYAVREIVSTIKRWWDLHQRTGEVVAYKIYTNIPIDCDAIDDYIDCEVGFAASVVVAVGDDFFVDNLSGRLVKWWDKFDEGAYIFLDEVQKYISSYGQKTVDQYDKEYDNWIALHRHKKQEIYFITQHTDSIAKTTLGKAEDMRRVVNIKNLTIPLLGIPLKDVDEIKKAFGCYVQYSIVEKGDYRGKSWKVEYLERMPLTAGIYACYASTDSSVPGDNEDLKLTPLGSLWWFVKKHWLHLSIKAALVYFFVRCLIAFVLALPAALSDAWGIKSDKNQENNKKELNDKNQGRNEIKPIHETQNRAALAAPETPPDKIVIIGDGYIYKQDGKCVKIGEEFIYNGKRCALKSVDVVRNVVDVVPVGSAPQSGGASDKSQQSGGLNNGVDAI